MRKFSLLFVLLLSFVKINAQELSVPYDDSFGFPIVEISVGGEDYQFLFDTGASMTVINSEVFPNLPISDSIENVGGIGSEKKTMDVVKFSFDFLDKHFENKDVLYTNTVFNLFDQFNCDNDLMLSGIIGCDIMKDYIVEINPAMKKIVFHNPSEFNKKQISDFTKIKIKMFSTPNILVKTGNQKRYITLDTGSTRTLSVSDFKLDKYINTTLHLTYASKGSSIGVHGINDEEDLHHQIYDAEVKLGNKLLVQNQFVETSSNDFNNMGFSFIRQFVSYLDIKGKKLYMKQIDENTFEETSLNNLGFSIRYDAEKEESIVVKLAKKNNKLKLGDVLLSINGEEVPANNCDTSTFLRKFIGVPLQITIKRDNKVIQIEQPMYEDGFVNEVS